MPKCFYLRAISTLILTFIIVLAVLPTSPVFGASSESELLLRFKPGVSERFKGGFLASLGLEVVDEIPGIQVLVIRVPQNAVSWVKSELSCSPLVDFVEENRWVPHSQVPNDQYYGLQWHLQKILATEAWDFTLGQPSVVVAVLDTGVDPKHPDLAAKLLEGYNAYDDSTNATDDCGHGTMVSGAVGALTNNILGISAVGWQIPILPIKVNYPGEGSSSYSLLAKGLVYAADKGAKIASLSWQIFNGSTLTSAAKYFVDKGGLVVAAGGNTGKYEDYTDNPYIVSVGATDSSDLLATFSSYGPYIDLSAPGVGIFTTIMGAQATSYDYAYGYASGTSLSTPITAGLAALIFSANPSLAPSEAEQVLESAAVDLGDPGYDVYYGWGRIDASKALRAAVGTDPYTDSTPPKVAITDPINGTIVSGGVTDRVDASDDVSVLKVELYKDGSLFATDFDSPYEFYWDTASDSDGLHTLLARAYDGAGNFGESSLVTVNVSNGADKTPPAVIITYPLNGSKVSGSVDISVSATDASGVSKVIFYINGQLKKTVYVAPYVYRWNTKSVKNGWYTISVKAYDSFGNYAQASIKVYVSNKK